MKKVLFYVPFMIAAAACAGFSAWEIIFTIKAVIR
jgi:hypothetical protein